MTSAPILELRGLTKRFGDFVALDNLSLTIDRGEFLTVLGASGSGKTTTLRLIAGFDRPTSGAILMDGADVAALPPFKRPVNTVFQQYALFPHMSVRDNVGYGLRMRNVAPAERAQRVDEALAMARLGDLGARAPRQLSGGQQQRVALARALVNRPRVLLLDEPLGALDLKLRREMQLELKQLQTQVGITFIYVTHDQEEALTMSDRIVLMRGGRIEQIGTPTDMYDRPGSRYVADFIGETNLLRCRVGNTVGPLVQLAFADTTIHAAPVPGMAPGQDVVLSIRPEHVAIMGAGKSRSDALVNVPGKVDSVVFVGSAHRVRVSIAEGQFLVAQVPPFAGHESPPTVGQSVVASWPATRGVIVRD